MKKIIYLSALVFMASCLCFEAYSGSPADNCTKDVKDPRGKMKPWKKGAMETGKYRNLFLEAGYSRAEIDAKLEKAYYDVFEGPDRVYFEVGDSMAYVSDLKNHDARTEGLSYGMMVAVQLNKKDVIDRLWRWTVKYMQHKQITFVPDKFGYDWTDPSYHLPAFYEVWAEYAKDGHEQFYGDCADTARIFLHRACKSPAGLNADATEFSGEPRKQGRMPAAFRFDSWRVPMNIAMDYSWYAKDKKWQQDYCRRIQNFLFCRGIDTFEDQFNTDGTLPTFILPAEGYQKLRHSLGLVSTSAAASLMGTTAKSWKFVDAVWNAKLEPYADGYFDPYYDGLLYLFSIMHLSGNYRIITPGMN